ncbi:MAG: hypothetical protein KF785_12855 [Gemmatimonadales bacterium]|nr:hypothetical protein [Gemmatimonadales bacterium]
MLSHRRYLATLLSLTFPCLIVSCATTGATLGSGVGDTYLERPPHYAGVGLPDPVRPLGYLPVSYQRGASQSPVFDPAPGGELQRLLIEMTAYLDSLGVGPRLGEGGSGPRPGAVPPDVRFGCETETGAPDADCAERGGEALGRGYQHLKLSVGRPSADWASWIDTTMATGQVEGALVITLEIGQYWIRQRGLVGSKEVVLGTDHVAKLPWLTSLETPVAVVQLTGALIGPGGKALRIGAEGLLARRTPLLISAVGGQALVTDDEIRALGTDRRVDLPGEPLVWQVGLRHLVAGLTGRPGAGG